MLYDSLSEREYDLFFQPPPNLPHIERNDGLNRENFEDENFANESTKWTLHHPDGCMHCRVYRRHFDELSPDFGSFTESPSYHSQGIPHRTYEDGIRLGRRLQEEEDYDLLSRHREQLHRLHERHENSLLTKERYRCELECMQEELVLLKDQLLAIQIAYDDVTKFVGNSSPRRWETSAIHELDRVEAENWEDHERDEDYFEIMQQIHIEDEQRRHDTGVWSDLEVHSNASDSESHDSSLSSVSSISSLSDDAQPPPPAIRPRQGEEAEELTVEYIFSLMAAAHTRRDTEALDQVRLLIYDAERTPKSKRTAAQLYLLLKWRTPSPLSARVPSTSSDYYLNPDSATSQSTFSPEIFVDASEYGIGFILNDRWLAWSFVQGHPDIPMGPDNHIVMSWAELIAAEMGILTFVGAGHRNTQVILRSDNDGVIAAFKKRTWTKNFGLDEILKRVLKTCQDANLVVIPTWISTKANPADKPSRGVYPSPHLMFDHNPVIPSHLQSILKPVGA